MTTLENMDDVFRRTASRQPQAPAVLGPRSEISYGDLDSAIDAAARALSAAGVRAGHTVGLHYPSGSDYIVLCYAIWRCRACVVPIATELAAEEKEDVCATIAIDFLISGAPPATFAGRLVSGEPAAVLPRARVVPIRGEVEHPPPLADMNPAFIRFTSGTTGQSKGVVLSHRSIHERIEAANEVLRIGPSDRVMWLLSMSYHFTVSIVSYLTFGAAVVLPSNNLGAAVFGACDKHRATLLYGSPMHCALLADYPGGKRLDSLRIVIATTASSDPSVAVRFYERYGVPISQALGVIEIGLPCINWDFARDKQTSVGRPLPDYEVRLDDVGLGERMQEIFFRGPGMLDAYYRPWQRRDEILEDGWFATRDLGERDADGCLFLRGRSKEMISVMGMKLFPQEVEKALLSHPSVAEAAAFGKAHERTGESVAARVVLRHGGASGSDHAALERELREHCARHLASYKVPEQIEFVTGLPRTASGKVLRRV